MIVIWINLLQTVIKNESIHKNQCAWAFIVVIIVYINIGRYTDLNVCTYYYLIKNFYILISILNHLIINDLFEIN